MAPTLGLAWLLLLLLALDRCSRLLIWWFVAVVVVSVVVVVDEIKLSSDATNNAFIQLPCVAYLG